MALVLLSLGQVPVHPSCGPLPQLHHHMQGTGRIYVPDAGRTPCPAPPQPFAGRLGKHREEKAGQKREHFQKKGGQPAPAICHRALGGDKDSPEHCRRGRPCCHHPEVQQHTCTSNPCRLPHLPPQRPPRHRDSRAEQQLPLAVNSHSCTGAATGDRPQPHVAVSENISGARRAAVPPAPCQAAVHRGPCLPGPTTTPLATQSLYLRAPLISF